MTRLKALRSKLKTVRALLRRGDLRTLLILAVQRLPVIGKRLHMIVVTRSHSVPSLPLPRNVVYRRLLPGEPLPLAVFSRSQGGPVPQVRRTRFLDALSRGSDGFVAEIDGRIVAYTWAAYHRHPIPEVRFELTLGTDEACTYASYVLPEFRYSRLYPGLVRFALSSLQERGIRSFIGYSHATSRHSIGAHGRMGYRVVGWIILIRLPFVHLQVAKLGPSGRPHWRFLAPESARAEGGQERASREGERASDAGSALST